MFQNRHEILIDKNVCFVTVLHTYIRYVFKQEIQQIVLYIQHMNITK